MEEFKDNEYLDFMKDEIEIVSDDRHPFVKQLEVYVNQVEKFANKAEKIDVQDIQTMNEILDLSADVRNFNQMIEQYRKKAIEPSRKVIQTINDCAKNLQATLHGIESTIKIKLATWRKTQEIKALEAQETIKELSRSLDLDMHILAPNVPKTMSSAKASTSERERVTFEIVEMSLIPDEYWIVDDKAIQNHINLGKRDIPGIKIIKERKLIIRRK